MNGIIDTLSSSIGKKMMMAGTGLCFCFFLAVHFIGNLTLYAGKDAFNNYAEKLHAMGPLVTVAEAGLLLFAIIHVMTGLCLFWDNFRARPQRYVINRNAGGKTIGSATMPYTGMLILIFIIYHLMNFHFVDKHHQTIFEIVTHTFENPVIVAGYVLAVMVAGIHVGHGFWSAFQSLGLNHDKYMPSINSAAIIFGIVVAFGFGFIPVYLLLDIQVFR